MDSIQALLIISFHCFKCFPKPVHLLIIHLSIHIRSAEDISKSVSTCIRSSSFEIVISFKLFNSIGAISLLSHLNGVSFEWALTHMPFPRILPDSSIFLELSSNSFKVWRKKELSSISWFLQDLITLFIVGSTSSLFILPEYLNNSWWCFSSSFSNFEDRRRVFL